MSERDLATEIHHQLISPESVDAALENWRNCAHRGERERMWRALASASSHAIEAVLARDPSRWDGPSEERERCARQIEAIAINIRDNGPKTPEGLLTALAGAQVGILFDAAAVLRRTQ